MPFVILIVTIFLFSNFKLSDSSEITHPKKALFFFFFFLIYFGQIVVWVPQNKKVLPASFERQFLHVQSQVDFEAIRSRSPLARWGAYL